MNAQLQEFARYTLKLGLAKLPEDSQRVFKLMYATTGSGHKTVVHLEWTIDKVVDKMPEEKLDWAMQQVENTLAKLRKQKEQI